MASFRSQSQSADDNSQPPLFYSPALPSELLWYMIHHCSYPTTLVVCSSRVEFLRSLARDVMRSQKVDENPQEQQHDGEQGGRNTSSPQPDQVLSTETEQQLEEETLPIPGPCTSQLLTSPLYQIAISRHIRTVFIPTVSHLRAFLSVFDHPSTSNTSTKTKAPVPPPLPPPATYHSPPNQQNPRRKQLIVYGLLALHRDSSEWSVQGVNNSVAMLLEAVRRAGLEVVVVEPVEDGEGMRKMDDLLGEKMPVVSGSALKKVAVGEHLERTAGGGGLMGKTVDVRRVLGRWFQFGVGEWERDRLRR
ncbi:hypothetical protein B0T20DRAFT_350526 [Sordaria brevicollis]|uniref:Uncharacterized protein n=1 Tax=Sordaria brevicollis TaxID=83679 RepID=A0AAE0PHH3_SORBR|nr:hypothetical protein B0T20DRAFT_350526 [Sordaria brevicollis]